MHARDTNEDAAALALRALVWAAVRHRWSSGSSRDLGGQGGGHRKKHRLGLAPQTIYRDVQIAHTIYWSCVVFPRRQASAHSHFGLAGQVLAPKTANGTVAVKVLTAWSSQAPLSIELAPVNFELLLETPPVNGQNIKASPVGGRHRHSSSASGRFSVE